MSRLSIGVVIATPGRRSLFRTIRSILYQGLEPGDDILVVGDGFHEPTAQMVAAFGPPFRYEATQQTRTWGHDQLNHGLKKVRGDILLLQDDDDIFAPRAFDEARKLAARFPNVPILGRVKTPFMGLLWNKMGADAVLDGHCVLVPNVKEKVGFFTREYAGDQAWIKTCLEPYEEVYWADRVWTITRPTWLLSPQIVTPKLCEKYGPYAKALWHEVIERLPASEGRIMHDSDKECAWFFFPPALKGEPYKPCALVKLYQDEERVLAALSFVPGAEQFVPELAEFITWAAQGLDVWMHVKPDDTEVIEALTKKGYQPHGSRNGIAEYISDWPPKFFEGTPQKPHIVDPRTEGGCSTSEITNRLSKLPHS